MCSSSKELQKQCLDAGKKCSIFKMPTVGQISERPGRNETGKAGIGRTVHALRGHGECLFLKFILNCSGLNAEAKSTSSQCKTTVWVEHRGLEHVHIIGKMSICVFITCTIIHRY